MIKVALKLVGVVAMSLSMSGCAIFHHQSSMARPLERQAARDLAYDGSFEFEFGRAALLNERYGQAITSFRKSEMYPKYQSESDNGLGIAYVALGRSDIGLHYFRKAVEFAPGEAKFLANLNRLEASLAVESERNSRALRLAAAKRVDTARATVVQLSIRADGTTLVTPSPADEFGLVRMSASEVQLVDRPGPGRTGTKALALAAVRKASGH